ncbi:hypothetical protein B0E48_11180 [Rhodanobacter sp. C03]|nr:hypothetical protein B0E48_11180 [Rhodanobacter sp. C03]
MIAGCGNGSGMGDFSSTSIANGAIKVRNSEIILHVSGTPDAVIAANGDLKINGQIVPISQPEREALQHYYLAANAVREHGIATGKAGVALAGESIKGAVASIASGGEGNADQQVEAGSQKVTQAAMKICQDLADIKTAQDTLAAQLPAFKPYAGIIERDAAKDCNDDDVTHR